MRTFAIAVLLALVLAAPAGAQPAAKSAAKAVSGQLVVGFGGKTVTGGQLDVAGALSAAG